MTGPLRVVIAEDEVVAREKLVRWVQAEPDLRIVAEAADGLAAARAVMDAAPDLLFLDVHMPGLSGLDVLVRAPRPPYVVFTTAHDQYAVAAFEQDAVDYLLKPFGPTRFRQALARVRRRAAGRVPGAHHRGTIDRLFAFEGGRVRVIPIAAVRRFEARDDYVAAWTDASRHLVAIRLSALAAGLDPTEFVRVHRSHVVRLDAIAGWTTLGGGRWRLTLTDGETIDTSRVGGRRLRALLRQEEAGSPPISPKRRLGDG